MLLLGEIAALTTALCWSITPILFTLVGRHIGPMVLNRVRLLLGTVFLLITHTLIYGQPFPVCPDTSVYIWVAASGIVGLALGDSLFYQSFLDIGPRKTVLILSTAPVFSTLLAWIFLGETLGLQQVLGIIVTLTGVSWVILRSPVSENDIAARGKLIRGISLSIGAALCQATGLILAKQGMSEDFPPLSVALVRMVAGAVILWGGISVFGKSNKGIKSALSSGVASKLIIGSILGPFAGVTLSMVAINLAPVGIASTLMATSPVLLIPLTRKFLGDRTGITGIMGTVMAVCGVTIIMLTAV